MIYPVAESKKAVPPSSQNTPVSWGPSLELTHGALQTPKKLEPVRMEMWYEQDDRSACLKNTQHQALLSDGQAPVLSRHYNHAGRLRHGTFYIYRGQTDGLVRCPRARRQRLVLGGNAQTYLTKMATVWFFLKMATSDGYGKWLRSLMIKGFASFIRNGFGYLAERGEGKSTRWPLAFQHF
jgi:hypothetical protein